jgi:hypothetical protein
MVERVTIFYAGDSGLRGPLIRYGMMVRLAKGLAKRNLSLLAFGFGDCELRLLLEGDAFGIREVLRGMKSGTSRVARRYGVELVWTETIRTQVGETELEPAVVWCHRAPVDAGAGGPLASPWSSHRDIMQYRSASFYDPSVLSGRACALRVHQAAGGVRLPEGWPPPGGHESLSYLMRVAGSTLGVLPANRRCFHLFAQMAVARGYRTADVADAMCLTPRRVRQLLHKDAPMLKAAMVAIADPQLSHVP